MLQKSKWFWPHRSVRASGAVFRLRSLWMAAAILVALAQGLAGPGNTSDGLAVESVNKYGSAGSSLANSIANGDGFIKGMTKSGSPWKLDQRWTNNDVYDTDFVDPERSGPGNFDGAYFDKPGLAISYFTGHGTCTGCSQQKSCNHTSQCNKPGPGEKMPGSCRFGPGLPGTCCYNTDRFLFTNSTHDKYGGQVDYSNSFVKWGENNESGNWAGAGTNGGTHMIILDISCGVLSTFWYQQLSPAIGGLQLLATIMPVTGDTANVSDRGATFAQRWAANPDGQASAAWLDTLNSLPQGDGGVCVGSNYDKGGGHGINGCGCNFVIAFGADLAQADSRLNEHWNSLRKDDRAVKGANWYSARWMCNYTLKTTDEGAFERP